jgi:hypothetical protein
MDYSCAITFSISEEAVNKIVRSSISANGHESYFVYVTNPELLLGPHCTCRSKDEWNIELSTHLCLVRGFVTGGVLYLRRI